MSFGWAEYSDVRTCRALFKYRYLDAYIRMGIFVYPKPDRISGGFWLCYWYATSRLGGVVPRQSHKLQAPVQFGEAQHTLQYF